MAVAVALLAAVPAAAAGPELKTDDDKIFYALGANIAANLASFALTPAEAELMVAGLRDGLKNESKVDVAQYVPKLRELAQKRATAAAEAEKKESETFLEKLAKEKGAEKAGSGLIYIPAKAGTGETPKATDTVKVNYKGTLRDGTVFDSSYDRGTPATFPLNRVIPCWTEGLQKMKVGGKAKLGCPSAIAYGDRCAPPKIKPGAALLFEVELLSIEPPAATPAAPGSKPSGHQ
jgi:FKBP-type peptidyl-prolyl cis-trans isomerase